MDIGGPGPRSVRSNAVQFLDLLYRLVFAQQQDGNCLVAALVNGVDCLLGREAAEHAKEYVEEEKPSVHEH